MKYEPPPEAPQPSPIQESPSQPGSGFSGPGPGGGFGGGPPPQAPHSPPQKAKKGTSWFVWALIGGGLTLFCCLGGGVLTCVGFTKAFGDVAQRAQRDAQDYSGRSIEECYNDAFEQLLECEGVDLDCRVYPQALYQMCFNTADIPPDFCQRYRGTSLCLDECANRGLSGNESCEMACGQLESPTSDYCRY